MAPPRPGTDRTPPGLPGGLVPVAAAAWVALVLAYGLGFWGFLGGATEPRPVLLPEVVLLILAAAAPPGLVWLGLRLHQAAGRLEARAAALAEMPQPAVPDMSGHDADELAVALTQAARAATAADLAEIRRRLDGLAKTLETTPGALETLAQAVIETRDGLAAIAASIEAMGPEAADLRAERAAERDEIRAALARMEERSAAAVEARELLKEDRESAQREREELRGALTRMEERASSVATDNRRLRAERVAAAAERDEIRGALARLEERALGSAEEERAAMIEMFLRIEAQQQTSERALSALLERREADADLSRARRGMALREVGPIETQPALPLPVSDPAVPGPLDWGQVIRALNFPRDIEDREGFRALRNARADRQIAECLQAAEDVLTLLSQDGIYMDDLVPDAVPPETWIAFARGERGAAVQALGAIRDEAALALARGRLKSDAVFRDSTLHFLRRFEPVLRRMAGEAGDAEIRDLASTRTGRAFMLIARVHGAFD